jgi:hypothetical protein
MHSKKDALQNTEATDVQNKEHVPVHFRELSCPTVELVSEVLFIVCTLSFEISSSSFELHESSFKPAWVDLQ